MNPESKKVFVLGLDGATFDVLKPLAEGGRLPNIAALMRGGVHAKLNSTILHHSAPAWTSFATGKNPGKHGIIGFTKIQRNTYKVGLVNGASNRARTMWQHLSELGKDVIVVNVPITYPPRAVRGVMVSGLDTPSTKTAFTYPPEVKDEILRVSPDYKINLHLGGYLHNDRRRLQALEIMAAATRARAKAVIHLMTHHPWDFFAVRFNSPDNAQHQYWSFMDETHPQHDPSSPPALRNAIPATYELLDEVVGEVLRKLDTSKTMLLIMSDHGAGPRTGKSIYVNEWLRSLHLLARPGDDSGGGRAYRAFDDALFLLKGRALAFLLRTLPPEVKNALLQYVPSAAGTTASYLRFSSIDWSKTKAFVGEVEGIRINRQGHYPSGMVGDQEYESLRERLVAEAKQLQDPETGAPIFKGVYKREDVFHGDSVGEFPDIILKPHDKYYVSPRLFRFGENRGGSFVVRDEHWRKISGSHRQYGIFIANGPDCPAGLEIEPVDIMNVFPTVLYQMGLPIPDDLDGTVAMDVFREEFRKENQPRYAKAFESPSDNPGANYTDADNAKLIDSLKGLGYIE
jgi:predicted AlkP superfamily phosphohydrolase/phosphomutase